MRSRWAGHAQTEVVIILWSVSALGMGPRSNPASAVAQMYNRSGMSSLSSAVFWRYAVSLIIGNYQNIHLMASTFLYIAWKCEE